MEIPDNKTVDLQLYILDPLSVIIKLAILSNKPIGTKISIKGNTSIFAKGDSIETPWKWCQIKGAVKIKGATLNANISRRKGGILCIFWVMAGTPKISDAVAKKDNWDPKLKAKAGSHKTITKAVVQRISRALLFCLISFR